jgi:hypothetical protein
MDINEIEEEHGMLVFEVCGEPVVGQEVLVPVYPISNEDDSLDQNKEIMKRYIEEYARHNAFCIQYQLPNRLIHPNEFILGA